MGATEKNPVGSGGGCLPAPGYSQPLHESTDAARWAREFIATFRGYVVRADSGAVDEGLMISWFANAIEAGRSAGIRQGVAQERELNQMIGRSSRPANGLIARFGGCETVLDPGDTFTAAIIDVITEYQSATKANKPFNSAHEGYAVVLEELDELKDEVFRNPLKASNGYKFGADTHQGRTWIQIHRHNMRTEAKQTAAMAIRFMVDVVPEAR